MQYKILDVPRTADEKTIRKAYRKQALQWHPDKAGSDEERDMFEKKFQELAEAHEILSDPEQRARYDRGEDVTRPQQQQPQRGSPFQFFQRAQGGTRFTFHFG